MVEGLAVWRISRNQFKPVWAEIAKNYPARKLELHIPQNWFIGQGGIWKIKIIPIFFRKGFIWFEVVFKHWKGLKLVVNLPVLDYHKKILFGKNIICRKILVIQYNTCWIYLNLDPNLVYFIMQNCPFIKEWNEADWLDPLIWKIMGVGIFFDTGLYLV